MRKFALALLALLLAAGTVANSSNGRRMLLNVVATPLAYGDSKVDQKMVQWLTRESDIRVSLIDHDRDNQPAFPADRYNPDSLLEWGREVGGSYLMLVEVKREGLECRKSFNLPLIFHKYETVGIIEGEFRLFDLNRGRMLAAEPFKLERKGPRKFQAKMDDDENDPDLHLTAPEKLVFFDYLEESLCQHLTKRVLDLAGAR